MKKHKPYGPYEKYFKRILDLLCGILAVIIFCWLYLILYILVRIKLGSPVLFKQNRVGRNNEQFTLYKFRTMTDDRDENGNLLPDEVRLTKFGRILRATSLDELPEAFNIIKGDMSVVGPRPLLSSYIPYYTEREIHRHDVKPGLSGLAQVNGRNYNTWEEIFELDLNYIEKITFLGDIGIVLKTVKKMLGKDDIVDVSSIQTDADGSLYVMVNGEKRRLHNPLDVERKINA